MLKSTSWIGACGLLLSWCRAFGADVAQLAREIIGSPTTPAPMRVPTAVSIRSTPQTSVAWAWHGQWSFPANTSLEGTPLAVEGVLYFTGSYGAVFAVVGTSGKLLWKYAPEILEV